MGKQFWSEDSEEDEEEINLDDLILDEEADGE